MSSDLAPLKDRLTAALAGDRRFDAYRDALVGAAEAFVVFDAPPEERPETPDDLNTMPYDRAMALYEAAKAERDRRVLDRLPLGGSRFGGLPDLPPDLPWPEDDGRKVPLLAQIDLAQLPRWEGSPLPAEGWLYHFGLYGNDRDWSTHLLYYGGPREGLVRATLPAPEEAWPTEDGALAYEPLPLDPRLGLTIDVGRLAALDGEDLSPLASHLTALIERADIREPRSPKYRSVGWLLGDMAGIDGPAASYAEEFGLEDEDWMNLLAYGSFGSMQWGDSGTLYLLIRRSDLAAGDFARVEATIGSA